MGKTACNNLHSRADKLNYRMLVQRFSLINKKRDIVIIKIRFYIMLIVIDIGSDNRDVTISVFFIFYQLIGTKKIPYNSTSTPLFCFNIFSFLLSMLFPFLFASFSTLYFNFFQSSIIWNNVSVVPKSYELFCYLIIRIINIMRDIYIS